ncbi:uncharacterized protein [Prorops nasuta]|uniref:uncharacterized protein n=1 Tax=Prorops nasuta TaxID=863751 RepID=UPI0034D01BF3
MKDFYLTAYKDISLEDVSYPPQFNLANIHEDGNYESDKSAFLNQNSSESSYKPNESNSEDSESNNIVQNDSVVSINKSNLKKSLNTTLEISNSSTVGKRVPNDEQMIVKHVESGSKKDFCIYCKTEQTKLARHLRRKHADVKEVKDFLLIPKGRLERKSLISTIRKRGQFHFNTNSDINTGELKVLRRPNKNCKKNATDFSTCPQCTGMYSKSAIRHHYRRCSKKNSKQSRTVLSKSRKVTGRIHEIACPVLRKRVFPTMRDDDTTRTIRYDELCIIFGNKLCEKYRDPHFYDMIRQKLRQLGRFLIALREINNYVDDLFSVLFPKHYNSCISAIQSLAGLNEMQTGFKTPSIATSLGTLLKQVSKKAITVFIQREDSERVKLTEDFLKLFTEDYSSSIARLAIETQYTNKRQKKSFYQHAQIFKN